jgi:hypothetical protein
MEKWLKLEELQKNLDLITKETVAKAWSDEAREASAEDIEGLVSGATETVVAFRGAR